MGESNPGPPSPRHQGAESPTGTAGRGGNGTVTSVLDRESSWLIETVISPFHCLYQDALHFHTQSQLWLARSEAEASRLARAALLLYLSSAEALVHQAAAELARPDLAPLLTDPNRPLPLAEAWRLLPAIVPKGSGHSEPDLPPWPQFAELLELRNAWAYPGPPSARRAYYASSPTRPGDFDPLEPHRVPPGLDLPAEALSFPRTGLPRDPYALRPRHLDTARSILDAAIAALDRTLDGALTRDQRHRREPVRVVG